MVPSFAVHHLERPNWCLLCSGARPCYFSYHLPLNSELFIVLPLYCSFMCCLVYYFVAELIDLSAILLFYVVVVR